jgi:RES domain
VDQMPGPPPDIHSRKIAIFEFNDRMFRTHAIDRSPIYLGKSGQHRFDSPDGSYGVLYAGRDEYCAFIETFARAAGSTTITTTELKNRCLSELKAARTLRLVDLTQSGTLVRIGADARLFSGDHAISQVWSKAFYDHPFKIDGLLYPSRLDPAKQALALFEGRAPKPIELGRQTWFAGGSMRQLLAEIVEHYALAVIEDKAIPPRKPSSTAIQGTLKSREP